jgi:hypothetical protein
MKKLPLGMRVYTRGSVLVGSLTAERWKEFIKSVVVAIGMTPVYSPAFWKYPYPGSGEGGNGFTIVQPITDSFVCLDMWSDHGGAYLFMCSCKPIDARKFYPVITAFGLSVHQEVATDLGFPNEKYEEYQD